MAIKKYKPTTNGRRGMSTLTNDEITTSRPESYRKSLEQILNNIGIKPYAILMGLNHSTRIIINDFAPTNPYPSAVAIQSVRDIIVT